MGDKSIFIGTVQFKCSDTPATVECIAVKHIVSVMFPENTIPPFEFVLYTSGGREHRLISEMSQEILFDYLFDYASYESRMMKTGKHAPMTLVIHGNQNVLKTLKASFSDTPLDP